MYNEVFDYYLFHVFAIFQVPFPTEKSDYVDIGSRLRDNYKRQYDKLHYKNKGTHPSPIWTMVQLTVIRFHNNAL